MKKILHLCNQRNTMRDRQCGSGGKTASFPPPPPSGPPLPRSLTLACNLRSTVPQGRGGPRKGREEQEKIRSPIIPLPPPPSQKVIVARMLSCFSRWVGIGCRRLASRAEPSCSALWRAATAAFTSAWRRCRRPSRERPQPRGTTKRRRRRLSPSCLIPPPPLGDQPSARSLEGGRRRRQC